jgi:hypothetical protein
MAYRCGLPGARAAPPSAASPQPAAGCRPAAAQSSPPLRRRRAAAQARAAAGADGASSSGPYPYNAGPSERPQKATLEHIFGPLSGGASTSGQPPLLGEPPAAPWEPLWQMSERNVMWSDDLRARLVQRLAADALGLSDEELGGRLSELSALLPGMGARLALAPPALLARLAASPAAVAARLLALKRLFPAADAGAMAERRIALLLDDELPALEAAAGRLRALLGPRGVSADLLVQNHPSVLDVDAFEARARSRPFFLHFFLSFLCPLF